MSLSIPAPALGFPIVIPVTSSLSLLRPGAEHLNELGCLQALSPVALCTDFSSCHHPDRRYSYAHLINEEVEPPGVNMPEVSASETRA